MESIPAYKNLRMKATAARKRTAQRKEDEDKRGKILDHQFQTAKCSCADESIDNRASAFYEYEVLKELDNKGQNRLHF